MKKLLSLAAIALTSTSLFTACNDDNEDDNKPIIDPVEITSGVVVVNEGSYYSNINGSATLFDMPTNTATTDAFQNANGRSLGGTPNDAVVVGDYLYIATTDENRVEIADGRTMKSVASIKVKQPRELALLNDGNVVLSSYTGKVYKIDTKSRELADSSEVVGANLEGITVYGNYVYVCNAYNADYTYNTNVVKLDAELNKVKDITVAANPTQIETMNDNVFLISMGNYNDVQAVAQQIDPATDAVTEIAPATLLAVTPHQLYLINAPYGSAPTYSVASVKGKTIGALQKWIDGTEIVSPYAMAWDYATNVVYVSSSALDPDYGGASYSLPGFVVAYDDDGQMVRKFDAGLNPGTIVFLHYYDK